MTETFPEFDERKVANYRDWRKVRNRKEAITRVTHFRYLSGDLDHTQCGLVAADTMGLNNDEKAWFAAIFGQSYRVANSVVVMQNFPKLWNTSSRKVLKWMEAPTRLGEGMPKLNGNRLIYGNDTKWNRWKLHDSIKSIQDWTGGNSLYESLKELVGSGDTWENRKLLEEAIGSWKQFGWMSTWLTLQMLWDFFKWDIDTWTMPFTQNWSSYNGIMYIYGKENLMSSKSYTPTKKDIALAESYLQDLREYMGDKLPYKVDSFSIESVLCEYRKTAYGPRVKEYTGWTTSELAILYPKWKSWWEGYKETDLWPILAGLMCRGRSIRGVNYDKRYFRILYETGMLSGVNEFYPMMPDAYRLLNLPHPTDLLLEELHTEWNNHSYDTRKSLLKRFCPAKRLRWKDKKLRGKEIKRWILQEALEKQNV